MFISVRSISLGSDISNSDAARWHRRSERFLEAVKHFDLKNTYQHYQPGVTLMWLNLPVRQAVYMYQRHLGYNAGLTPEWYPYLHSLSKFGVVLVLTLLMYSQFKLVNELYNREVALLYTFFMALEPYLIGIDRWFHLTSLEVYFGFTSFLLLLYGLKKANSKAVLTSAVLYGLSVLSKFTSLIVSPYYFVLLLKIVKNRKFYLTVGFIAVTSLTVFLLFPALWVNFGEVSQKLIEVGIGAAEGSIRDENIYVSPYLYYVIVLLFKLSAVTLVLTITTLVFSKYIVKNYPINKYIFGYLIIYMLFLTVFKQKIDRYALVFLPPLLLTVSSFVSTVPTILKKSLITISILFYLAVAYTYHPVYSAYYSPLFGGTAGALKFNVYDNSGEYFAQAASYLNKNYWKKQIFIPDNIESFKYYSFNEVTDTFNDSTDFVVKSYDTDRPTIIENSCANLLKGFGPKGTAVVNVFSCN